MLMFIYNNYFMNEHEFKKEHLCSSILMTFIQFLFISQRHFFADLDLFSEFSSCLIHNILLQHDILNCISSNEY